MAQYRNIFLFAAMALLILLTGFLQSWNSALLILNMGLISAIMSLGVNLQWGFAGLFNVGVMGVCGSGRSGHCADFNATRYRGVERREDCAPCWAW